MNSSPLLAGLEPDRNNAQHLLYTSGYKILQMNPKTETSSMTSKVIYENKFWGWALFSAILATALFFIPFFQQGAGRHAGFVLNGDAWHLLAAQLDYSRFLVHHGIFSGLDFWLFADFSG